MKTKDKSGPLVKKALAPLLTRQRPQKIETDAGSEFLNKDLRPLAKRLGIKMYNIYSDKKCAIVERANRTLKTRMYRYFTSKGTHVWYKVLNNLVDGYNNSYHRSIGMSPNEVNKRNEATVRKRLFPPIIRSLKSPKFKVGDAVRINRKKHIFQKGYEQTWTHEVFYITHVKDTNPVTYAIKDYESNPIKGSFYESELQIVDKSSDVYSIERVIRQRTRGGKKQYLVKWEGYSDNFNSWINRRELVNLRDAS